MTATIVAAILMGSLGYLVRQAEVDAGVTALFRFVIGFVIISAIVGVDAIVRRGRIPFSASSLLSGAAIGLCILFYFYAIERISIGLAAFTLYLGPVFAIIGEAIISRRVPSPKQLVIITLAFVGFFLISSITSISFSGDGQGWGVLFALLAGIFYGAYILLNRLIPEKVTLKLRIFWQFLAAVIAIGSTLLFQDISFEGIQSGWPYVVTIGLVQGFLVLMLTGYAIKHLSSIEFGSLSYIEPLVAVILGFYVYNEDLSATQIAGIVLIVAATMIQCLTLKSNKK